MIPKVGGPQTQPISFKSKMKDLYKKGKLKGFKYGLYGDLLDIKNVTDEHVCPKSWGGPTIQDNLALSSKRKNNLRGNKPLSEFLTKETLQQYIDQCMQIKTKDFDGPKYVQGLLKWINKTLDMEKFFK